MSQRRNRWRKGDSNAEMTAEIRAERSSRRHPRGLTGREIGMFYRNKRLQADAKYPEKQVCSVILSDAKIQQIHVMLKHNTIDNIATASGSKYSNIKDSCFKRDFVSLVNGNIVDKLESFSNKISQQKTEDEKLYEDFTAKAKDPKYINMINKRKLLPAFEKRNDLIKMIEENQVCLISGETGCGKTTQVAQFILDYYIEHKKGSLCKIICTQPRRISAISIAERVAEERAENLGHSVGFQIRLEKKMPRNSGSICFCTTGVILKQMESDPALSTVSHIILDEIHERNVVSDFLITLLKQVLRIRSDLKVILMSATLNAEAFSKYYNNCPHINIPGFTYPVTEYFLEDVLQMTKFVIREDRKSSKPVWMKHVRKNNRVPTEFENYVVPYARQLRREGKYDDFVCTQLANPNSEDLNLFLLKELLIHICQKEKEEGAILIFLTGVAEISSFFKLLQNSGKFPSHKYLIIPLHSMMPTVEQKEIFNSPKRGVRKIIISTNIAETSITIDDVVYVIDCGKIKMSNYDAATNIQTLNAEWVSVANANQRRGRAGRVKPGVCYHLFSKVRYEILDKYQKPEILRERPDGTILTAKILQLGKVEPFFETLMDPPDPAAVSSALHLLRRLDALDDNEDLTPLGYHLAKIPIAPQIGKMILFGAIFSCLDPILSVAASLDFKDAFQVPIGKEREVDHKRKELAGGWMSDHLLLYKALELFESTSNPRYFCREFFLSSYILKLLQKLKRDFMGHLKDLNFAWDLDSKNPVNNKNSNNLSLVKAVICAGLYPNVATVKKTKHDATIKVMGSRTSSKFHPKSVLANAKSFDSPLLVYWQKLKSSCDYIHDASLIHAFPILFFGDHFKHFLRDGRYVITIGNAFLFKTQESTAKVISELRQRLNWFLQYKIAHPGVVNWDTNKDEVFILRAIMELITVEEIGDTFDEFDDDEDDDNEFDVNNGKF